MFQTTKQFWMMVNDNTYMTYMDKWLIVEPPSSSWFCPMFPGSFQPSHPEVQRTHMNAVVHLSNWRPRSLPNIFGALCLSWFPIWKRHSNYNDQWWCPKKTVTPILFRKSLRTEPAASAYAVAYAVAYAAAVAAASAASLVVAAAFGLGLASVPLSVSVAAVGSALGHF